MLANIINLIRALIQWVWRTVSQPWIRLTILGTIISIVLIIILATGTAFVVVYGGIISFIVIFGILSIWIPGLRGFFITILIVGALLFFSKTIVVEKIAPKINQELSSAFPHYDGWRKMKGISIDNKLAEDTIQMKKTIMMSEVIKGTFGKLTENSIIYNDFGVPLIPAVNLLKGQRVMSLGLESKDQLDNSEGLAFVLIANEYGDFVKSRSGLIPIRKIEWDKENPPPSPAEKEKYGKWKVVGDFPVPMERRTLNLVSGRNGERAGTGEVWIPYILLPGWEYRITFSGKYQKRFWSSVWKSIIWYGDNSVAGQNVHKPFNLPYGALVLRIGKAKIFPAKGTDNVSCAVKKATKIFAELNISREPGNYFTPELGYKLQNKNLSIKIERRRLKKE